MTVKPILHPIITLTTDWGIKDPHLAALRGDLLTHCSQARIVDISHSVNKFDVQQGAYIFKNACSHFPENTIHMVCVRSQLQLESEPVVFQHQGQFFIGVNDGFFPLVFEKLDVQAVVPPPSGEKFTSMDTGSMVRAAAYLISGKEIGKLGKACPSFETRTVLRPVTEENLIKGSVIYIDEFENAVTNISQNLFERIGQGRRFEIYVRGGEYHIKNIKEKYSEGEPGLLMAIFNSNRMLEISISQGSAAALLGLGFGDIIRIEFRK